MSKQTIILFILLSLWLNVVNAEHILIVNIDNPIEVINKKDLKRIYLMKKRHWDHNELINPVNLAEESDLRNEFSRKYLKKSPNMLNAYYMEKALSGKGHPPKMFYTEKEVINFVSENKGAIAYVSKANDSVKIIHVK